MSEGLSPSFFSVLSNPKIEFNIGDKESSSDLETGAEPHRLELEEEFGWRSQQAFGTLYPLFNSPLGLIFNAMLAKPKNQSREPYQFKEDASGRWVPSVKPIK